MSYATLAEFPVYGGLPATALGALTSPQQQAQLDSASTDMDAYFRQRPGWTLPLLTWDDSIKAVCCQIAAYKMICLRGFNPAAGADITIRLRWEDAHRELREIQKCVKSPEVTFSASPVDTSTSQPRIISSSMTTTGGGRGASRGW